MPKLPIEQNIDASLSHRNVNLLILFSLTFISYVFNSFISVQGHEKSASRSSKQRKVTSFFTKKQINNQNDPSIERDNLSGEAGSHHIHCEPLSVHSISQQQINNTDMAIPAIAILPVPDEMSHHTSQIQMFQLRC